MGRHSIDAGYPRRKTTVFEAIRGLGQSPDELMQSTFHSRPP